MQMSFHLRSESQTTGIHIQLHFDVSVSLTILRSERPKLCPMSKLQHPMSKLHTSSYKKCLFVNH